MAEIKLFVCCHRQSQVPSHPLLVPVQVGAALAETHVSPLLYHEAGDGLSSQNGSIIGKTV